jgi:glycosyltransferase involved in cell wall biosynthesis
MKIVFVCPYPFNQAPSQRFRFEQYLERLQQNGYTYSWCSFYSLIGWKNLYKEGEFLTKSLYTAWGFVRRIFQLMDVIRGEFVFLHREAAPIGPPVFEWIIARILRKKIIYDFDDAIWLTDRITESKLVKALRWRSKVGKICNWSYKVSCGNQYLADYARKFTSRVVVNPTTIDTENAHNPYLYSTPPLSPSGVKNLDIIIGWTGSHSTIKYLSGIVPVLQRLQKKYDGLVFLVIADQKPDLQLNKFEFILWQKETEVQDLLQLDIGVMPLPDDVWTRGKCGFKALQYMATGIPCVVSAVGVNADLVDHGRTGFLATTEDDWINFLERLINDEAARIKMGEAGRKRVINHYSVASNAANFLSLFT